MLKSKQRLKFSFNVSYIKYECMENPFNVYYNDKLIANYLKNNYESIK